MMSITDTLKQRGELSSNPYSRVHQEKISRFLHEIGCASVVLGDQLDCVKKMVQYVGQGAVVTPWTFQQERAKYILQDCTRSIQARIQNFEEMRQDAAQMASSVSTAVSYRLGVSLQSLTKVYFSTRTFAVSNRIKTVMKLLYWFLLL